MRWILIVLLMCNGIYFLWHNYMSGSRERMSEQQVYQPSGDVKAQIELLKEASQVQEKLATAPQGVTGNTVGETTAQKTSRAECLLIGPFKEMVSAKQVQGRLKSQDITLRIASIAVEGRPDYWVHIAPQVSRKAAIKLLRELQSKKIDSFLITDGELENGISLGFFTRKSLAQQVYDDRIKQGYKAIIREVPRTLTQIWAVYDIGKNGNLSAEVWEIIKEGNNGLQRRKNYCDKIASLDDLD